MSELITIDKGHDLPLYPPQCSRCRHYNRAATHICTAFPDGIPEEILTGEFDHSKAHEDDKGIRFTST